MAQVFRKSAIEKLSSPEQLDKAIVVTSPMSWAALAAAALIIAAVIVWAFLGRLPDTVSVSGVIAGSEGADCVLSSETGVISEFCVKAGDKVASGDVIARVSTSAGEKRDILADRSGTVSMLLWEENTAVTGGSELIRLTPDNAGERAAVFYVPVTQAQEIRPGMDAVVTLPGRDERRLSCKVVSVSSGAVSVGNMALVLGADNGMSEVFASAGPVCSVICSLPEGESAASDLIVSGKIVISESAPVTRFLTDLKSAGES